MPGETRIERRLDRAVDRATTPRGAAVVIAVVSVAMTLLAGFLMTVLDHENYRRSGPGSGGPSRRSPTVGYGDNVADDRHRGRLIAALVMFFGIGFLTVITAAIAARSSRARAPS